MTPKNLDRLGFQALKIFVQDNCTVVTLSPGGIAHKCMSEMIKHIEFTNHILREAWYEMMNCSEMHSKMLLMEIADILRDEKMISELVVKNDP